LRISSFRRIAVPAQGQRGQGLVIFALAFVFLIGIVGLATDGAFAYFRSVSVERAASAAALAGVPYMPLQFKAPPSGNAWDRARAEAASNGFADGVGGVTVTPFPTGSDRELGVTVTAPSATFFMNALGFRTFNVSRTAVAGYKPPIALGQPGAQTGSEVSKLGSGTSFYFPRYKGWNNLRSEGDAFTPNPLDNGSAGAGTSADVHQFSKINGIESSQVDCMGGSSYALPCRGGYNWRVVVPDNVNAEVDVYNAAYAPDFGNKKNTCENSKNLPSCNASGYHYHEDDVGGGNHCAPTCSAAQKAAYNATGYTLFQVPDLFLRAQDKVLTQTKVLPIDATNWDGAGGGTGGGSSATPSYVNVNTGAVITQNYTGVLGGSPPCNMNIYHSWIDIANYDGSGTGCLSGDGGLVSRQTNCLTPCTSNNNLVPVPGTLGGGTYRLRVDALNSDGTFTPNLTGAEIGGNASKGYSVRVVDPITKLPCAGCTIAAWQDICVYTPLNAGTGTVPLFELTSDYAGATIDVDVFDIGDSGGDVALSILDPSGNPAALGATGSISNSGISRLVPGTQHIPPQSPAPLPLGSITPLVTTPPEATYSAATSAYGPEYQGSWIRLTIPIPAGYSPGAYPADFWSLRYVNTGGANDTFTFTVTARGGPVHLRN